MMTIVVLATGSNTMLISAVLITCTIFDMLHCM